MHRIPVRAASIATIMCAIAAGRVTAQVERRERVSAPGGAHNVDIVLTLQPEHASQRERLMGAAGRALRDYADWFGAYPLDRLAIVDRPWRSPRAGRVEPGVAAFETRWIVSTASVEPEADIARGISRQWWGALVAIDDAALVEDLVEFSQGKTVEQLFADRNRRPGYSLLEGRYFGDFVPWTNRRVALDRASVARGRPGSRLITLERYLGWPALQRGLAAVMTHGGGRTLSRDEFFRIVGDAVGQDLQWFSDAAFQDDRIVDYAVGGMTSVPADCHGQPCFRTTVVGVRNGAAFTGSRHDPVGPYESGRAINLLVAFENGATARETWDGRSASKPFVFESRARAASALIDPDHVLVLEKRITNNGERLDGRPAAAAVRWSARWVVWLQDALLSYASLV